MIAAYPHCERGNELSGPDSARGVRARERKRRECIARVDALLLETPHTRPGKAVTRQRAFGSKLREDHRDAAANCRVPGEIRRRAQEQAFGVARRRAP